MNNSPSVLGIRRNGSKLDLDELNAALQGKAQVQSVQPLPWLSIGTEYQLVLPNDFAWNGTHKAIRDAGWTIEGTYEPRSVRLRRAFKRAENALRKGGSLGLAETTKARSAVSETAIQLWSEAMRLNAEELVGFQIRQTEEGAAVVVPTRKGGTHQVIGVHNTPPNLVLAAQSGARTFGVTLQQVQLDGTMFQSQLADALTQFDPGDDETREFYASFLADAGSFVSTDGHSVKRAVVWGPAGHTLLVAKHSPNSIAQATPVTPDQAFKLMYQTTWQEPTLGTDPAQLVIEQGLEDESPYYQTPSGQHMAAWEMIVTDREKIPELAHLNVEVTWFFEKLGREVLWCRMIVRARGTESELAQIENGLRSYGKVRRVWGIDPIGLELRTVHYQTVPGSPYDPSNLRVFSLPDWPNYLQRIAAQVDATGAVQGNMPVGLSHGSKRQPIFFDWLFHHAVVIEGPTRAGKTLMAMWLAYTRTHRVILIHFTSTQGEIAGHFAEKLGGQYLNVSYGNPKNQDEFREEAARLEKSIDAMVASWEHEYKDTGELTCFPITLRPAKGSPVLHAYYVDYFLKRIRPLIGRYFEDTGRQVVVVADDLIGIPSRTPDIHLGNLSVQIGSAVRDTLQLFVDSGRKMGVAATILTLHGVEELAIFGSGFWKSLPLFLRLRTDEEGRTGQAWYPPDTELGTSYDARNPYSRDFLANAREAHPEWGMEQIKQFLPPPDPPSGYLLTFDPTLPLSIREAFGAR